MAAGETPPPEPLPRARRGGACGAESLPLSSARGGGRGVGSFTVSRPRLRTRTSPAGGSTISQSPDSMTASGSGSSRSISGRSASAAPWAMIGLASWKMIAERRRPLRAHVQQRPGRRHAALRRRVDQHLADDALAVQVVRLAREDAGLAVQVVAGAEAVTRDQRLALDARPDARVPAQHDLVAHRMLQEYLPSHRRLDADLGRAEDRVVAVAGDDVRQLGRVGQDGAPAVLLGQLAGRHQVEAGAAQEQPAGLLDGRRVAEPLGGGPVLVVGRDEQPHVRVDRCGRPAARPGRAARRSRAAAR